MSEQKYSDSLQFQYESLSKSHESLIRSRNQQVRESQESYLSVLKDLESHKAQALQKRKEMDEEIYSLKRQISEQQRAFDQHQKEFLEQARLEKDRLESQLVAEKISRNQIQDLYDQGKEKYEDLSSKSHDLSEKVMRLISEKQNLEEAVESAQRQFSRKESELISYQSECDEIIKKSEEQVAKTTEALSQSEQRVLDAKAEMVSLEKRLSQEVAAGLRLHEKVIQLECETSELQKRIETKGAEVATAVAEVAMKEKQNSEMNAQMAGLRRALIAEKKLSLSLRHQVDEVQKQNVNIESSERALQATLESQISTAFELKRQIDLQTAEANALKETIANIENALAQANSEIGQGKEEISRINGFLLNSNSRNSQLEIEKSEALKEVAEARQLLSGQAKLEHELRFQLAQSEELHQAMSANLSKTTAAHDRLKTEISVYEQDLLNSRRMLVELEQSLKVNKEDWAFETNKLKSQVELLKVQLSSETAELVVFRRELDAKKEGIENKERLLRCYSDAVNAAKVMVRDQILSLLRELELFKSINPMAEYYKLTLREISRVESKLSETPQGESTRDHLQDCLADLIEQREFQKALLERFQQDFDYKLEKVSGLIGAQAFTLMPPPPPIHETGVNNVSN